MLDLFDRAPVAAGAAFRTPEAAALRRETPREICGGSSNFLEPQGRRTEVISYHGREFVKARLISQHGVGELFLAVNCDPLKRLIHDLAPHMARVIFSSGQAMSQECSGGAGTSALEHLNAPLGPRNSSRITSNNF